MSIGAQTVLVEGAIPNLGCIVVNTVIRTYQWLCVMSVNAILIYIFKVV